MKKSLPEDRLEINFIKQLEQLGYQSIDVNTEEELLNNLKIQIEIFNKKELNNQSLSNAEFDRILNHLEKGSIIDKSIKLRDRYELLLDNGDTIYIRFLNTDKWCQNIYQVTHQITVKGKYENRYDVTILINGLPLTQVELKKNGVAIKEAFNQINRYQKHSYSYNSKLFQYIQIFVISNETNTKYYTNNTKMTFENTFFWADKENKNITNLQDFTNSFLEHCQLSKMISQYIVISETQETNFILKPYQCYATEAVVDRIDNTKLNGYIWHTTGSGKTLTSFKTAQILKSKDNLSKVLFVVDRRDLDYQTIREFNNFSEGCVDGTENTNSLFKQLLDKNTKLIVTTMQKLNIVVKKIISLSKIKDDTERKNTLKKMKITESEFNELVKLSTSRNVFIFDECHRSQFGESHKNISEYFQNTQLIGFTGTPIFEENSNNKKTTKDLFTKKLHDYTIVDAISDENVLGFSIKYVKTFEEDEEKLKNLTEKAYKINIKEIYESKDRMNIVIEDIISRHNIETNNKRYNGIFAVSNIDSCIKYYKIFKEKKHNLKIATIFSFTANEEDREDGNLEDSDKLDSGLAKHSRDELEDIIKDYNKEFSTNYSTKTFEGYYKDISKRVKNKEIDILIVVNMFLTGFDSKKTSVLYTDKFLKYHGILQAFSRTNRIDTIDKPFGNIVSYRNIKKDVDKAIELFANKEANEIIFQPSYEELIKEFKKLTKKLRKISKTPSDIDEIKSEKKLKKFVILFRNIIRLNKKLSYFPEFEKSKEKQKLSEYDFDSYTSKYLDIYDKVHKDNSTTPKSSILNEINFEIELLSTDRINVDYILKLLRNLDKNKGDKEKKKNDIFALIDKEPQLRNKKELIKEFIESVSNTSISINNFNEFKEKQKQKEIKTYCEKEKLNIKLFKRLLKDYCYSPKENFFEGDNSIDANEISINDPKILERESIVNKTIKEIKNLYKKYC